MPHGHSKIKVCPVCKCPNFGYGKSKARSLRDKSGKIKLDYIICSGCFVSRYIYPKYIKKRWLRRLKGDTTWDWNRNND